MADDALDRLGAISVIIDDLPELPRDKYLDMLEDAGTRVGPEHGGARIGSDRGLDIVSELARELTRGVRAQSSE